MELYLKNSNKLDFQYEVRILNGIWFIIVLGLVVIVGLVWGVKYFEIMVIKYDLLLMYVVIGLLLFCMYGLSKDINKINVVIVGVIYLFLFFLVVIVVVSLVFVYVIIIVFSIVGVMFLISMLVGLLFNVDFGFYCFIIMMMLIGLVLVIIVNVVLMSEWFIWVISCLMIVLWLGIILYG